MTDRHALLHRAGDSVLAFALALALVLALGLAGCASNAENMTSASPDQPWTPRGDEETGLWSLARTEQLAPRAEAEDGAANFSIPADAARAQLALTEGVDPDRTYRLPELIDLAQRSNPATRAAWQQARQAALAVGMVEATYLPVITASVIGGYQDLTTPLPDVLGESLSFDTSEQGTLGILALQWLLFDFGQRQALATAAKHTAIAANILFNGTHQKLIFEVSQAYYVYGAAIQRQGFAETALRNAKAVQAAVEEREAQGLATSVEAAQARQAVAQAELRRVQADGEERDAYQNLLAAVGVNAALKVDAMSAARRPLPAPDSAPLEATVRLALSQRPDVAASYSAMQASKAGVKAAQAGYLPKIYAGGNLASGTGDFDISGLPSIGQQGSGNGLLLGVTVPLYDAGLRDAQVSEAKSQAEMAADEFQQVQTAAVTEIVGARNALRTALESHRAATALVAAASTTYDAALAAYHSGVGTVDAATAADTALLDARQAQAEAHAGALIGAVNLAFVVGSLTSRESLP
ncbi:TolC family protein [Lamprobacter modestohalophilus]|uniref:TolC family protein n=1 Tax=Lamprobacter modestohalophilus TaxID=1064514 RepID=UPI002ADEE73F|nr:TolC family protein [Lamprobacter modestohalophilus]MEA1052655.1 TolC family protein [Lamprobacter modestohalophilus]